MIQGVINLLALAHGINQGKIHGDLFAVTKLVSGVPHDGVEQDPWHTEKQDKSDRTINLEAAMQMTLSCHVAKPQLVTMMPMQPTPDLLCCW